MIDPADEKIARWEWISLAAMVAAGLALRLWYAHAAPGLWYDEAIYGLDSLDVLRKPGYWPIFFDRAGHMREPMYMYIQAVSLWLQGGPSAFHLRATNAVIGAATIPVVWLLARRFSGAMMALLAAFLFTFLRWHVHFSGLAFRTILSPLFSALVLWLFLRLLQTGRWRDALWCGAALGAGAYTYLSFRLMPLVLAVPMLQQLWFARAEVERGLAFWLKRFGVLAGVALVVFTPLGIDYLRNPDHFSGRGEEVSFLNEPDATAQLLRQTRDVALMFIARGDHEPKHNVPGPPQFWQMVQPPPDRAVEMWELERDVAARTGAVLMDTHGTGVPVLNAAMGLVFYLGFGLVAWRSRREPAALALVSMLVVGSLASILSRGAPNMLRLIFVTPVVVIFMAEGIRLLDGQLQRFCETAGARMEPPRGVGWLHQILSLCLVGNLLAFHLWNQSYWLSVWPHHPMVPARFNTELSDAAEFLARQPDRLSLRVPDVIGPHPTIEFIADGYRINPPREQSGERWWEFRTVPPFPPLEEWGVPITDGRAQTIMHPAGIPFGTLVEVEDSR